MYVVLDKHDQVIAFHEDEEVVERYVKKIYELHKIGLRIKKIKKSSEYKLQTKDDLYLVRYHNVYVQSGYLVYLELRDEDFLEDELYVRDILCRMLEFNKLRKSQRKKLESAVKIVEEILEENRNQVPTLDSLQKMKLDYDPYFYNTGLPDSW